MYLCRVLVQIYLSTQSKIAHLTTYVLRTLSNEEMRDTAKRRVFVNCVTSSIHMTTQAKNDNSNSLCCASLFLESTKSELLQIVLQKQ